MDEDSAWQDGWWQSADGLRLHYRDYPGPDIPGSERPGSAIAPDRAPCVPVLCIPGLTRNARDFEGVAARLSAARRVIVVELRGRGRSDWSPDPETYHPGTYLADVRQLLDLLGCERVALFGSSLGGIVTMLLAAVGEPRLAGFLLNDIGPIIDEAGLERIRHYVGSGAGWADWDEATAAIAAIHGRAYPDYRDADWRRMARQLCREADVGEGIGGGVGGGIGEDIGGGGKSGGPIVVDYDPAIAVVARRPTPKVAEPWGFVDALAGRPGLLVRGGLSDILAADTAAAMAARLPELEWVTLPRVGHPPTLDEPAAQAAVDRLLARIDARAAADTRL